MADIIRLDTKGEDGQTLRNHLEQVAKTKGERPPQLDSVEPPWQAEYVWGWFWELHSGRQAGMSGPLPLSWTEIKAWADLHNIKLDKWELSTIKAMDSRYLEAVMEKHGSSHPGNKNTNSRGKTGRR